MLLSFAAIFLNLVLVTPYAVLGISLDGAEKSCLNEFGYQKDIIRYNENRLEEDNSDMNTFFSCVWKKKGLQRYDGSIDFHKIYDMLIPEIKLTLNDFGSAYVVIQSIEECEKIEGTDYGDTAVKTYNCLYDQVSKYISEFKDKYDAFYKE
ncbi:hypothetical protein FQR65_LT00903 [Abscondita terminalis]|nr:hypothetical protein FQR65_LT00903 [Abscondita terminalis]